MSDSGKERVRYILLLSSTIVRCKYLILSFSTSYIILSVLSFYHFYFVPLAASFPSNSQNALKVVKSSLPLSSTHSAVAPTKYTYPAFISSVLGPTLIVPSPLVQMRMLGPWMASKVALPPFFFNSVRTTLNSSMGGS